MTGGASGALRQELREVELLDEITKLHYLGKLHKSVGGCTRNHLIKSFREWKGHNYVPQSVHKSLRWTKQDPLNEGEIEEIKWKIVQPEKKVRKGQSLDQSRPIVPLTSSSPKQNILMNNFKRNDEEPASDSDHDGESVSKKARLHLNSHGTARLEAHRTLVPLGLRWMQNSCAYDASLVILYSLYCRNISRWTACFESFQNDALSIILDGFEMVQQGQRSFEQVRDHIRRSLEIEEPDYFRFGGFTCLMTLWDHILRTPQIVRKTYYQCENEHRDRVRCEYSAACGIGVNPNHCISLSQWMFPQPELSPRSCSSCTEVLFIYHEYMSAQPLLALEFAGHRLKIDNQISIMIENTTEHIYNLVGIIYYGDDHFTARIISEDEQIWFHDGITTKHTTQYDGSLTLNCPELYTCRGKRASLALYSLDY